MAMERYRLLTDDFAGSHLPTAVDCAGSRRSITLETTLPMTHTSATTGHCSELRTSYRRQLREHDPDR